MAANATLEDLVELLNVAELRGGPIGALTFGANIPALADGNPRTAYPTAPTWQVSPADAHLAFAPGGQALVIPVCSKAWPEIWLL